MVGAHIKSPAVTVVGAGIIGICTALYLQRSGYKTVLIDRDSPAAGCSSGNAGIIATYGVTPVSMPGLWKQAPNMLLDPVGPLTLRWQHLATITPWLWRLLRAGNPQRVFQSAVALNELVQYSLRDYIALSNEYAAARDLLRSSPLLCVYENRERFEKDRFAWQLRHDHGVRWTELEGGAVQEVEPALASDLQFALMLENTGFTLNPQRFAKALFDWYIELGGQFKQVELQKLSVHQGRLHLHLHQQRHEAGKVVLACGAWSGQLAAQMGERIPLEAERGYHLTLSGFEGQAPSYPVMSPAYKVITTPMEMGLRIAGMVEFGGFLPPDYRRSAVMQQLYAQLFPAIRGGSTTQWMGHRPTLPDSLPVIGQSTRCRDLYYAFGHQHIGLTAAPMTAQLVCDLIQQRTPTIDPTPYRVDRF